MVDFTMFLPAVVSGVSGVAGYGFLHYSYHHQSSVAYRLAQAALAVMIFGMIAQVVVLDWSNVSYMWSHRGLWFGFLVGGIVCLLVAGVFWVIDTRASLADSRRVVAGFYGFVLMWVAIILFAISSIAYAITQLQYRLGVGSIVVATVIGAMLSFLLAAGANWIASHDWGIARTCQVLKVLLMALGVIFLFVGGVIWEYPGLIQFFWGGR